MECKDCKHYNKYKRMYYITHICNTQSCTYLSYDKDVEEMNICYNCKYWIGGGDWGLSCEKDYYNCSTNGFNRICEQFERRQQND